MDIFSCTIDNNRWFKILNVRLKAFYGKLEAFYAIRILLSKPVCTFKANIVYPIVVDVIKDEPLKCP